MTPTSTNFDLFKNIWQRCLLPNAPDNSLQVHQQLLAAYNEPQRVYHSLNHIEHCLTMVDHVKHLAANPDALELSIWFHDVIYAIGASDNEQLSADHFMALTNNLFDEPCRESVYNNIMATLHTGDCDIKGDAQYMVDIDLSSFGLPWDDFLNDSEKVRAERTDIPEKEAYTGQLNFKQTLLKCPRFFMTDYFFEHYETQAKNNLERYCDMMCKKLAQ